jgi:hypothetical protein
MIRFAHFWAQHGQLIITYRYYSRLLPRQLCSPPPVAFWSKLHDAVEKLAARLDDNAHEDGWKLLHRSKHGEEHEMELEEGYKVRVHMLLAE